ncbi:MAG: hypothetical protein WCK91_01175 [bacterium]
MPKVITVALMMCSGIFAQSTPSKGSVHMWVDAFAGNQGEVVYPQYQWSLDTKIGGLSGSGYGFIEMHPHETLLVEHAFAFAPGKQRVFSVQMESDSYPSLGQVSYQVGPRLNIDQAIPGLDKLVEGLFVAVLPRLVGGSPDNVLVSGATNPLKLKGVELSVEGYRRFYLGRRHDYSEYLFVVHPKATKRFSFTVFTMNDSVRTYLGFGTRIDLF